MAAVGFVIRRQGLGGVGLVLRRNGLARFVLVLRRLLNSDEGGASLSVAMFCGGQFAVTGDGKPGASFKNPKPRYPAKRRWLSNVGAAESVRRSLRSSPDLVHRRARSENVARLSTRPANSSARSISARRQR